ncbi:hypothetical protein ACFY04_37155 [Streptomyces sp. NPDC001549]|uniref:hypothetical protein n=1 Tax=Streptomyces sp. NPDC001549 TaxID=3364586 RepID=UPI0036A6C2C4
MSEMATIAVSAHVDITGTSAPLIREASLALLARHPASELTGISCPAERADALFAESVLAVGGQLPLVLVPSSDYRARSWIRVTPRSSTARARRRSRPQAPAGP